MKLLIAKYKIKREFKRGDIVKFNNGFESFWAGIETMPSGRKMGTAILLNNLVDGTKANKKLKFKIQNIFDYYDE